jgi:poly-D-alanine transfer protein DltD
MEKEEISKEQINQMINEIKQIERELYVKKSRLARYKSKEHSKEDMESEAIVKRFTEYIKRVGQVSIGGNSVEDVRKERDE